MQITHDINDPDWEWHEDLPVQDVQYYCHPSYMTCAHDYSCPICRENHAVHNGSTGVMEPCWPCQGKNWKIIQVDTRPWWKKLWS